jgi:S1-C subfamily serine protease
VISPRSSFVSIGRSIAFLASGPFSAGLSAQGPVSQPVGAMQAFEQARIAVFQKAAPSVVILEVELLQDAAGSEPDEGESGEASKNQGRPPARRSLRSEGSGFVVRKQGVIATNLHVVAQARRITVRFRDGRRVEGRILGADERTDVAVIQVEASDLSPLEFSDSDQAAVGQFVYAIGVPFGQEWSFTSGMLSGKGRSRLLAPTSAVPLYEDYLQTDAFINPGHSGGPLLDSNGRVLGMNTLVARQEKGIAFAVPSNLLQQTIVQILETGRVSRPWLGIRVETLGETAALTERLKGANSGVVVLAVEADGPAFRTDLRPADVIQSLDGKPVGSALEFQRRLFEMKSGQVVRLGLWRQGASKTLSIPLAELPGAPQPVLEADSAGRTAPLGQERFGLTLRELKGRGLKVEGLAEGSVAARSDLQRQDIITEVENRPVRTLSECITALRSAFGRSGTGVALLQIEREGRRTFVLLHGN